eukprot:g31891.t1
MKRPAGQDAPRWVVKENDQDVSFEEFQQSWQPLPDEDQDRLRFVCFLDQDYYFSSYARLGIHEDMLKDEVRTGSYMEAIENSQPSGFCQDLFNGKTVLDVGSGTGILSLFAVRAGARQVLGVERSEVVDFARTIAEDNGFREVVTYVQGKVEEVELPVEKVDIIVSEWMGYFLMFDTWLLLDWHSIWSRSIDDSSMSPQWIFHDIPICGKRLCCAMFPSGGQMFPDRARLLMAGIEDADYKEEKLGAWCHVRGFDFSPVAELALQEPLSEIVDASAMVTSRQCVFQMDLTTVTRHLAVSPSRSEQTADLGPRH